jgi:hypothetical protein
VNKARIVGFAFVAALLGVGAAGCTSVSTEPDQTALHYEGGSFSSKKYASIVGPSKKEWFGPGDKTYLYPAGQRAYDATGGPGAEHTPFTSSSKDSVELATPMSVTLSLKTDEKSLRTFHEQIGIKYKAYANDGSDDISNGWISMLNFYVGQSLDATVDRVLAGYDWRQAYNDPAVRVKIQDEVQKDLPTLVDSKMNAAGVGGYFDNYAVQVQRPVPTNQTLRDNIAAAQNQVAQAEAAKAKADADLKTAQAQILVQQAEANKKKADISAYGSVAEYNKAQAIDKGINPYQPTYVVSGTAPGK